METLDKTYWEERYKSDDVAWDTGSITPPIKQYIDQLTDKNARILVPGAGNGHEFAYLAENGFENATVLDIAETPLKNIAARLPHLTAERLINADFFEHYGTYNLIIEQTFFCALPPALRQNYVTKMHSLLAPGGKLAGLLFDFELTEQGPPFGGSREEYVNLFAPLFKINMLHRAYNSIKRREGKELFFIFEKK
ncbi:SAM-dependent methyltransferase [Flavobacterium sp. RHBU_24]|uniref:SAM-dependent methyltransferase n=1 Tax=Flavobacterium sp. RHBU_24 TaxID=3391185 RepID=UPI003984F418